MVVNSRRFPCGITISSPSHAVSRCRVLQMLDGRGTAVRPAIQPPAGTTDRASFEGLPAGDFWQTMICVSLAESTPRRLYRCIQAISCVADVVEIRLDTLEDPWAFDVGEFIRHRPLPVIFTNRSADEGGCFQGTERQRIDLLVKAVSSGADYVDIELATDHVLRDRVLKEARRNAVKTIISYHDFSGTPAEDHLIQVLIEEKTAGADIGKIVTMARDLNDVFRVLSLYFCRQREGLPLIAFCMGTAGKASRLACLYTGAILTYAAPAHDKETAPGQIPVRELKQMVDSLEN